MFGMVTTSAQLRTEYSKLLLRTFDFWFLQAANTICTIVLSFVLNDLRVVLIVFCWADFTCWLLQETYLRNSHAIVVVALAEWLFYVLLMAAIAFELVDEAHHYILIASCGRTLSTKDVLANTIGTMTLISLRNLYRRYQDVKHKEAKPNTATQALGYRSKPTCRQTARPLLQLYLSAEAVRFDPSHTVWPRVGALTPLSSWKIVVLYLCCVIGSTCAVLALLFPKYALGHEFVALTGLVSTAIFTGIYGCCCQRQLLKRIITSFHFLFLWTHILALGLLLLEMFRWRWVPVCGVGSSLLLAQTVLTIDALTPIMKRRLHFQYWMPVLGIALFLLVQVAMLFDVFTLGRLGLEDKVILDVEIRGRNTRFLVVPIFVSRVFTGVVWSGRYVYVVLTRQDDNALILLRGEVEFDYEGWKKRVNLDER
ncbi:hypothetical protein PHYSODRAFT_517391 [Phytophthora sojae]|uniref:Uncharacterized protein n=1 Tax=Phytophthora sojae (strain P6497) TaxID=1094619 RepID=G4ZX40_PHYSP|nr:hypothetical protein PHYSODRAFT_517391 [Phytophthora sojae]EGZ12510.1 hypothetical protein PHYSODRAFT_517391 [Phytophthora sojae]|eukprot:XP_009532843.1 hypothetical protein PHYSODRAFT_517391 [Phytophthora sojae]